MQISASFWKRLHGIAAFGAISVCLAPLVRANFIVSSVRYTSGPDDVVVFSALNDGTGGQTGSTKLQSLDLTMTSVGAPLVFNFQDIDGDGVNDANVLGYGMAFPSSRTSTMPAGTFVRIGSYPVFYVLALDAGGVTPAPYSNFGAVANPTANYTSLYSFNVQGSDLGSAVPANITPAPFAVAVVPFGTEVYVTGDLWSEVTEPGSMVSIFADNMAPVPEPAAIGAILIAVAGIMLGRRPAFTRSSR